MNNSRVPTGRPDPNARPSLTAEIARLEKENCDLREIVSTNTGLISEALCDKNAALEKELAEARAELARMKAICVFELRYRKKLEAVADAAKALREAEGIVSLTCPDPVINTTPLGKLYTALDALEAKP